MEDGTAWNASEGPDPLHATVKPKEDRQTDEEEISEGERRPKPNETKEHERDVYMFTGDSDPESPPAAPWARCTFIQRSRMKHVLLRPFAGFSTLTRTQPDAGTQANPANAAEQAQPSGGGRVYDFEDVSFVGGAVADMGAADKPVKCREGRNEEEESVLGEEKDIFTCVECSIYFKKQTHLKEHMMDEHAGAGWGRAAVGGWRFQCTECGCNLPNRSALTSHHRRHQESRLKILGEIEKLNENGKVEDLQQPSQRNMATLINSDPAVAQDAGCVSVPDDVSRNSLSDLETVSPPPLSSAPLSTCDGDPTALDLSTDPSDSTPMRPHSRAAATCRRRRFVCPKCNFNTKTSQALANHLKIHRRRRTLQADVSSLESTSLACGHCAFLASSQSLLREHQTRVHPGQISITGAADETVVLPNSSPDKSHQGITEDDGTPPDAAASHPTERRLTRRQRTWTDPPTDSDVPPASEKQRDESTDLSRVTSIRDTNSPAGAKQHVRGRSDTGKEALKAGHTVAPSTDTNTPTHIKYPVVFCHSLRHLECSWLHPSFKSCVPGSYCSGALWSLLTLEGRVFTIKLLQSHCRRR